MSAELAANVVAMRQAQTHQQIGVAVMKKAHELQQATLESLMQVALSAPPPGQGLAVNKLA